MKEKQSEGREKEQEDGGKDGKVIGSVSKKAASQYSLSDPCALHKAIWKGEKEELALLLGKVSSSVKTSPLCFCNACGFELSLWFL